MVEMKSGNIVKEKSFAFAKEIVYLYKVLSENKEFVLSRQLLRSGTSIGANVRVSMHRVKLILYINFQSL